VSDSSIKNLFKKEMTRRQFLGLSVFALASLFGIVGIIEELKSHAATPFLSEEAENGTLKSPATLITDTAASAGKAVKFGPAPNGDGNTTNPPPSGTSLSVDFRSTTFPLDKWSLGGTILTEWGSGGTNIVTDATWRSKLTALGPLSWRIPLNIDDGTPTSSEMIAGGNDGASYLKAIVAMGGTPYPIVQGKTSDNAITSAKVAAFVHYFNDNGGQNGGKIERLILGNEPENVSGGLTTYLANLDGWISAAKGADSTIKISAPAASFWDESGLQQAATHSGVDILSFHAYDGANTDGNGFPETAHYNKNITTLRGIKTGLTGYGLEETNYGTGQGSGPLYDWHNYTWLSSVIGQVMSAGGNINTFADINGMLGMMNDGGGEDQQPGAKYTTFPSYWAVGMWTGMNGQFARYGSAICPASSTIPNLDCFATNNGKIMIINKDAADHAVTIGLGGRSSGTYSLWQSVKSTPLVGPSHLTTATAYTGSTISITVPAGTVSSLELS
jgi:hypothetical protein